jgi:hypothetical protein
VSEERQRQSPAAAAAEQVRAIVEAAERETEEQLRRVQQAADGLGARADEIERELERLAEGIRDAVRRLREDLKELRSGATAPDAAAASDPAPEPVAKGAVVAHAEPPEDVKPAAEREQTTEVEPDTPPNAAAPAAGTKPVPAATGAPAAAGEPAPAATPAPTAAPGPEGARVIALNMALNGSPREETAAYLAENFELDDPEALLDDVYARAGG